MSLISKLGFGIKALFLILFVLYVSLARAEDIQVYSCDVVNTYPHNENSYTQGLVFEDGFLYEGSGRYGFSALRQVELKTGRELRVHELPSDIFGEGVTIYKDKIIQLTWRDGKGFVYNKKTFEPVKEFGYDHEGWGITHDGVRLIISDGSARLRFLDPETFKETGYVDIYDDRGPVKCLNELEYVKGMIYANVWKTDRVAIIDARTGRVGAWIDLKGILKQANAGSKPGVPNGIAYDASSDRLFVTGKLWPWLFEIKLVTLID